MIKEEKKYVTVVSFRRGIIYYFRKRSSSPGSEKMERVGDR
jgi:hypothetical protein